MYVTNFCTSSTPISEYNSNCNEKIKPNGLYSMIPFLISNKFSFLIKKVYYFVLFQLLSQIYLIITLFVFIIVFFSLLIVDLLYFRFFFQYLNIWWKFVELNFFDFLFIVGYFSLFTRNFIWNFQWALWCSQSSIKIGAFKYDINNLT